MTTLRLFRNRTRQVHPTAAWYLSDLGEFRGKQELYTRQSPQRLKALREHAIIESAVSSNRIEGVSVDPARVRDILGAPKPLFRDRDEEEVRGYRDALAWIHNEASGIPIDEDAIKRLHALTRGQIWDAGQYKDKDGDIVERYLNGQERVRFSTVPAAATPTRMGELVRDWRHCLEEAWVHPLIALAAFNRGAKTDQVLATIGKFVGDFTVTQLEHHCPGVSRDMIRRVLREQQAEGAVACKGRGPAAKWLKKG